MRKRGRPRVFRDFVLFVFVPFVLALLGSTDAGASGRLVVEAAWIRAAPPGSAMRAGYAVLRNAGDTPVVVRGATSTVFESVSLHETVEVEGVERMRALGVIEIAPGSSVALAPGGRHLMLMRPLRELASGATATIHFDTDAGAGADADFVVREAPPDH